MQDLCRVPEDFQKERKTSPSHSLASHGGALPADRLGHCGATAKEQIGKEVCLGHM